jgi:CSLREA domain-containing protein
MRRAVLVRLRNAAVVLGLAAAVAAPLGATSYLVTVGADETTTNGNCTLREALLAATTNAPRDACAAGSAGVPDVIQLVGITYTWTLGSFAINGESVEVRGPATATPTALLDLGDHSRFLYLIGATVVLQKLVVRDGNAFPDTVDPLGGVVRAFGSSLTLRDSNFVSSRAVMGGVVAFQSSGTPLLVERCLFTGNSAESGGGFTFPQGGALLVSLEGTAAARIVDSRITANRARSTVAGDQASGGGFRASALGSAVLEIVRVEVENNVATPGAGGFSSGAGAILFTGDDGRASISDTTWSGSDVQGNGVNSSALTLTSFGASAVRIDRARFTANDVGQPVGQLFLDASGQAVVVLADALVADGSNVGVRARAAESSTVRVGHVTLAGCATGAALEATGSGVVRIENSLFWDNGLDVADTTPSAVDPSTMTGTDPFFVDPASGDYSLGPGSPAMDFGNFTLPSVGAYDLLHAQRVVGPQTDAGAFERGGLFADGFEGGDAGDWAGSVP